MDQLHCVLLEVWAVATRQIELAQTVGNVAAILRAHMPLARLVLVRIDSGVNQIAAMAIAPEADATPRASTVESRETRQLLAWHRKGQAATTGKKDQRVLKLLAGPFAEEGVGCVAVPLTAEHGGPAALIAVASGRQHFSVRHAALLLALREPLEAVLANDARLHELSALREAAEAERSSLLRRLGRKEL